MASIFYEMYSGETLTFEATDEEARFLERVRSLVARPDSEAWQVFDLIYSDANPALEARESERPKVSLEFLQTPLHATLHDQFHRKFASELPEHAQPTTTADHHSMTVTEAAQALGVSPVAVRQAIKRGALDAIKQGNQYRITPTSVDVYEPSRRGRGNKLELTSGHTAGMSLRIQHDGQQTDLPKRPNQPRQSWRGILSDWSRLAIMTKHGKTRDACRLYLLQAGSDKDRISLGPFEVQGRFTRVWVGSKPEIHALWRDPNLLTSTFDHLVSDEERLAG